MIHFQIRTHAFAIDMVSLSTADGSGKRDGKRLVPICRDYVDILAASSSSSTLNSLYFRRSICSGLSKLVLWVERFL